MSGLRFEWCEECADHVVFEVVDAETLACGGCGLAVWVIASSPRDTGAGEIRPGRERQTA